MGLFSRFNYQNSTDTPFQLPSTTYDVIMSKLSQRDWKDKWIIENSWKGLAGVSILSSLVLNSFIRRSMMLYEGFLYSSTLVSVTTTTSNNILYKQLVQWPLLEGKLNCSSCAMIRAAGLQMATTVLFPALLSFSIGIVTAEKYGSVKIPHPSFPLKQEFRDYFKTFYPNIRGALRFLFGFQALVGASLAYQQYRISQELVSSLTQQEIDHLWKETVRTL